MGWFGLRARCLTALIGVPAIVVLIGRLGGDGVAARTGELLATITALLAAGAVVCGSRPRDGRERQTWLLVAVALVGWAIGQALVALRGAGPAAGAGEVALGSAGYVALVPLLGAGLLQFLPRQPERGPRLKIALDALIGLASFLTITWFFVLDPVWFDAAVPGLAKATVVLHALGNAGLLMTLLVVGLRFGSRPIAPSLGVLAAGAVGFVVADTLVVQRWVDGIGPGVVAEALRIAALATIGLAALIERRSASTAETAGEETTGEPLWRVILPYPLALTLVGLVAWQELTGTLYGSGTWILLTCLTVVAVVIVRQGLTVRDARRLTVTLSRQVDRDPLTGLVNHRKVHDRIGRELAHGREWGHPLAIALIDVDDFKLVNDSYGHLAGDQVLRTLANSLTAACRGTDVAARYAGDELLLVLPGADLAAAHVVCERVLRQLGAAQAAAAEPTVGLSIGAAITHGYVRTAEQLVAIADAAMYDAKEDGKNRVVVVDADALVAEPAPPPEVVPAPPERSPREAALPLLVP